MEPRSILLIEDDADIRRVAEIALQFRSAHHVLTAEGGEEGLKLAREHHPDVILLDVMMPGMDGYETCRHLKGLPETAEIPVIFLTARNRDDTIQRWRELGAVGFIAKPFDPLALAEQVEEILQRLDGE